MQVFEYHLNWFEATGFSEEQVQFLIRVVSRAAARHMSL